MKYKLYLLHTGMFEEEALQQKALGMMDTFRKEKVMACKREEERRRQLAAGLLLQAGVLECGVEAVCIWNVRECINVLEQCSKELSVQIPVEAVYEIGAHGKPVWSKEFLVNLNTAIKELSFQKRYPYFSLSHSGAYAALVISDKEIGIDIQKARDTKYLRADYRSFSRFEAYAKCTGKGIAGEWDAYRAPESNVNGYTFEEVDIIEGYAVWLCQAIE